MKDFEFLFLAYPFSSVQLKVGGLILGRDEPPPVSQLHLQKQFLVILVLVPDF